MGRSFWTRLRTPFDTITIQVGGCPLSTLPSTRRYRMHSCSGPWNDRAEWSFSLRAVEKRRAQWCTRMSGSVLWSVVARFTPHRMWSSVGTVQGGVMCSDRVERKERRFIQGGKKKRRYPFPIKKQATCYAIRPSGRCSACGPSAPFFFWEKTGFFHCPFKAVIADYASCAESWILIAKCLVSIW